MINYSQVPNPSYVVDETLLRSNLSLIKSVKDQAGIDIIVAFKGFSMWGAFPIVREYVNGATASSLWEARLCFEEMKTLAHTYSPAYVDEEFDELMEYSSYITFNSLTQLNHFLPKIKNFKRKIAVGIRVNPEFSDVETDLYNPCAPGSRLGTTAEQIGATLPEGVEGLHFHTLCESSSFDLENTLKAFEEKFAHLLPHVKWVNMGGGHLMTKKGYDTAHLVQLLKAFKDKYKVEVILEPGSAFAWQTGDLVAKVVDIVENKGITTLIANISFTGHMPDCLEMPYKPKVVGATDPIKGKPTYRIGGNSCLSGDYMGDWSFEKEVHIGDLLVFEDMIHYTMVKTTTFNGVNHPSIGIWNDEKGFSLFKKFGYEDYKGRLS